MLSAAKHLSPRQDPGYVDRCFAALSMTGYAGSNERT